MEHITKAIQEADIKNGDDFLGLVKAICDGLVSHEKIIEKDTMCLMVGAAKKTETGVTCAGTTAGWGHIMGPMLKASGIMKKLSIPDVLDILSGMPDEDDIEDAELVEEKGGDDASS